MAQWQIQLQASILPNEYLDQLFAAADTIVIWLSYKCNKCSLCHTDYGLKVYHHNDRLTYRMVRLTKADDLNSAFYDYSECMKKKRKNGSNYKFTGCVGDTILTVKFKCSSQGNLSAKWIKEGYFPKHLHVCHYRIGPLFNSKISTEQRECKFASE